MSVMNRMSRVINFRMPSAPGWKVQYNFNDQQFTLFYWKNVKQQWRIGADPTMLEVENEAERRLKLESDAMEYDRRADDADFTDLFPSF